MTPEDRALRSKLIRTAAAEENPEVRAEILSVLGPPQTRTAAENLSDAWGKIPDGTRRAICVRVLGADKGRRASGMSWEGLLRTFPEQTSELTVELGKVVSSARAKGLWLGMEASTRTAADGASQAVIKKSVETTMAAMKPRIEKAVKDLFDKASDSFTFVEDAAAAGMSEDESDEALQDAQDALWEALTEAISSEAESPIA